MGQGVSPSARSPRTAWPRWRSRRLPGADRRALSGGNGDKYENWGVLDTEVNGVRSPVSAVDHGAAILYDDKDLLEALADLSLAIKTGPTSAS
jgi:hypothetical protein